MENLFSTHIAINDQRYNYHVIFDQEKYIFLSDGGTSPLRSFSLIREHDEWHDQNNLQPEIKKQAVDVLEGYLLKQH